MKLTNRRSSHQKFHNRRRIKKRSVGNPLVGGEMNREFVKIFKQESLMEIQEGN